MKKITIYDKEKGQAIFKIIEDGRCYIGKSKVHPDDKEMASELTGLTIAEYRAKIKRQVAKLAEANKKRIELEAQLKEVNNYYKDRLTTIISLTEELETFISDKEKFYISYKKLMKRKGR